MPIFLKSTHTGKPNCFFLELLVYHGWVPLCCITFIVMPENAWKSLNMILAWHFNHKKIFYQNGQKCISGMSKI